MEKQLLLIYLQESPQIFIVKCYKHLCRQLVIMEICTVFFFFPHDSDRIVLLLKQYYYLLLRADIEIKMMKWLLRESADYIRCYKMPLKYHVVSFNS